jgi:hypothetical protein
VREEEKKRKRKEGRKR